MSALTAHSTSNTNEAQFLAPETRQQAGGKAQGKTRGTKAKGREAITDDATAGDLIAVPLSRLVLSPLNMRKHGGENVDELAALIKAQGLMQNLVVIPHQTKRGKETDLYGVIAGGRRLRALKQLAGAGDLSADAEIICKLTTIEEAIASSVAENSGREPMSVADTVTAFAAMLAAGAGIEDVAVCFGISPLTVRRRLKLAGVSPKLFALFRADKMNLDQLMALAISDDHTAQERAWESTPPYSRHASTLRRQLLGEEIDASRDTVARFVGLAAYEAAGGPVVRDLFAEEESGYIADVALLHRLAMARLTAEADTIKAEGWSWAEARISFDHSERHRFVDAPMGRREPSPKERAQLDALAAEKEKAEEALEALYQQDDAPEDQAEPLEALASKAEAELDKLQRTMLHYTPEVMAHAGVIVTIDYKGAMVATRGLVKPEDRKQASKAAAASKGEGIDDIDAEGEGGGSKSVHSESLVRKLTAHRTKALQIMLADNTQVALASLAQTLLMQLVVQGPYGVGRSPQSVRASGCDSELTRVADDMQASRAWVEMQSRLDNWRERIPGDPDRLLTWLIGQPQDTLLELLSLCSALSLSVVASRETERRGDALATAVGLDMADWWSATSGAYLAQISKAQIVGAVSDAVSPEQALPLGKMKKGDAVAKAEALLDGKRWLPSPLRSRRA